MSGISDFKRLTLAYTLATANAKGQQGAAEDRSAKRSAFVLGVSFL
jgi:hypothetical protein